MTARTKLNQQTRKKPASVRVIAARENLEVGRSANNNLQFKKEPLQHLYEIVVSTLFGKDTYYQSSDQLVRNLIKEVTQVVEMDEFDFVANLAIHARTEMNIRTIPIVLVVQFAHQLRAQNKSYPNMRRLVCDVIQRADQITDLYAYALSVFGDKKHIPMAIKRGVSDAFNKFGEYHFAKYSRNTPVKFRDVLRIVHPVAINKEQGDIFQKIMEDSLSVPYTWETELSRNGQLHESERKSKAQLWTELYTSGKMGYMAQLRNLRNLVESGTDSATIAKVADFISDPNQVLKSKQLPFDFVEAYNILAPLNTRLSTALSKAIDVSCSNIPKLGDKIWIIIDFSGSMGGNTSPAIVNATMLAAGLIKSSDMVDNLAVTLFGSDAMTIPTMNTNRSIVDIRNDLMSHRRGNIAGSTNFHRALEQHSNLGFVPDTIVVFTDGEVNYFPYDYLVKVSAKYRSAVKLTVNLNAAPTTPMIRADGWFALAGWSSAMFKFIPAMRERSTAVDILSGQYKRLPRRWEE